jgi:hypothetical protein
MSNLTHPIEHTPLVVLNTLTCHVGKKIFATSLKLVKAVPDWGDEVLYRATRKIGVDEKSELVDGAATGFFMEEKIAVKVPVNHIHRLCMTGIPPWFCKEPPKNLKSLSLNGVVLSGLDALVKLNLQHLKRLCIEHCLSVGQFLTGFTQKLDLLRYNEGWEEGVPPQDDDDNLHLASARVLSILPRVQRCIDLCVEPEFFFRCTQTLSNTLKGFKVSCPWINFKTLARVCHVLPSTLVQFGAKPVIIGDRDYDYFEFQEFCRFLPPKLRILSLDDMGIDRHGIKLLVKKLGFVETLSLRGNGFGDIGSVYISALSDLKSLDVSGNEIGDVGAEALSNLSDVISLNLSWNNIGFQGAESVSKMAKLETLNMCQNIDIVYEGVKSLAKTENLCYLKLSKNLGDISWVKRGTERYATWMVLIDFTLDDSEQQSMRSWFRKSCEVVFY